MTSVIDASCERLDKYLTVEASQQLFEMLRHRKKIVAMLDKIKETDYVQLTSCRQYWNFLMQQLISAKVHMYNVAKIIVNDYDNLYEATQKVAEYTSRDNEFFQIIKPNIVRKHSLTLKQEYQAKWQVEEMIANYLTHIALKEQHMMSFKQVRLTLTERFLDV